MTNEAIQLQELGRAQCFALLGTVSVGRIAYSDRALPAIVTVSFACRGEEIMVALPPGGPEPTVLLGSVVAFHADGVDATAKSWSVSCVGRAEPVEAAVAVTFAAGIPLWAGALGRQDAFLRIVPELVRGQCMDSAPPPPLDLVGERYLPAQVGPGAGQGVG